MQSRYLKDHPLDFVYTLPRGWSGHDTGHVHPHGGPVLQAQEGAGGNTARQGVTFLPLPGPVLSTSAVKMSIV